jgi:cytochrome P450
MADAPASAADDLTSFDPFDRETLQCPFPHYARMRAEAPVLHVERLRMYVVSRHDLVLEVLRDPRTYSSSFGAVSVPLPREQRERLADVYAEGYPRVPTMLTADPPSHTRYRRLVSKAFTPRVVAALEPEIRRIAVELIESWIDRPSIEFVSEFAVPLPVRVIARALDVPDDRLDDFKRWSDDSIAGIGTMLAIDDRVAAERGVNEFQHYFADQLEQRREHPRDDFLTSLLNARIEPDEAADTRPLDLPEMLSILQQLLVAGNETTTKMLTEMMRLLGEHSDQWQQVRADPARIEAVLEETLRLSTPTQGMFRVVTRDVELGGVSLTAGDRIVVVFSSANRDEALFEHPDHFDPDRSRLRDHVAFGRGIHTCLGAGLSRLEARVALEELSRRVSSFELAAHNTYEYFPSFLLRGLLRLDIDITPVPSG